MSFCLNLLRSTFAVLFSSFLCVASLVTPAVSDEVILADYQDDFQGTSFPTGWQYLWNAPSGWPGGTVGNTNPVGDPANYSALQWSGARWDPDGDGVNGNNQPAAFSGLTPTGGHPALGSTQAGGVGNTLDRFVIASYTVTEDGPVYLSNSVLTDGGGGPTGAEVFVHVNNNAPTFQRVLPDGYSNVPFNHYVGNLSAGDTVYVAIGPDGNAGTDGFTMDYTLTTPVGTPEVVANYRNDFQGTTFPDNWQYLWNAPDGWPGAADGTTNPVGDPSGYVAMQWSGTRWDPDGDGVNGNNDPAGFARLEPLGGHPGLGDTQTGSVGNTLDRAVIAAYQVEEDGLYAITDSFFSTGTGAGDGNSITVHVNGDAAVYENFFDNVTDANFDVLLGELAAGDTVFVAIGAGPTAGNDNFDFDFSITRFAPAVVPEPASLACWVVLGALLMRFRRNK